MDNKQGLVDWDGLPIAAEGDIDYWAFWRLVDPVSIREATRLLATLDPKPWSNRTDKDRRAAAKAEAWETALIRSVQSGSVRAAAPLAYNSYGYPEPCDASDPELGSATTVPVADVVRWADECGIPHQWPRTSPEDARHATDLSHYPAELRAAIEAFNAVHANPRATVGKTPKQALRKWLDANKDELSGEARERISMVANWQPGGGAPKTPG